MLNRFIFSILFLLGSFGYAQESDFESIEEVRYTEHLRNESNIIDNKGNVYKLDFSDIIENQEYMHYEESIRHLDKLSIVEAIRFNAVRKDLLTMIADSLRITKGAIGIVAFVKNKITAVFNKSDRTHNSISEEGRLAIQNILNSASRMLWKDRERILKMNDVNDRGFVLNYGPAFFVGFRFKDFKIGNFKVPDMNLGGIGGAYNLGIYIGKNNTTGKKYVEIFYEKQNFKSGFTVIAGLKGIYGMYIRDANDKSKTMQIDTSLPLIFPVYKAEAEKGFFSLGGTSAITLPPAPFTDAFFYTLGGNRTTLYRKELNDKLASLPDTRDLVVPACIGAF